MGLDFCALLKCEITGSRCQKAIQALEQRSPDAVLNVAEQWRKSGGADLDYGSSKWIRTVGRNSVEMSSRPPLPDVTAWLVMPEEFFLSFGIDAVCISHILRWRIFLTEPEWQTTMLAACNAFADLFAATEGVLTNDESPVIQAFHEGASYDDALAAGTGAEGEVVDLSDLYQDIDDRTWDSHGYWKFLTRASAS